MRLLCWLGFHKFGAWKTEHRQVQPQVRDGHWYEGPATIEVDMDFRECKECNKREYGY